MAGNEKHRIIFIGLLIICTVAFLANGISYNDPLKEDDDSLNNNDICIKLDIDLSDIYFYPHEYDCSKYYKYSDGNIKTMDCPFGLVYNKNTKYCDLPEKVKCINTCPVDSEYTETYFPHEIDCDKYYKCNMGVKVIQYCSSGLLYNHKSKKCDWAINTKCYNQHFQDTNEYTETNQASESTGSNFEASQFEKRCPLTYGQYQRKIFFQHEYDCSKYYKCAYGKEALMQCPDDLFYNDITESCDYPKNVNCSWTCPTGLHASQTEVMFPHETDCSKFYKCKVGVKVVQSCPVGLSYHHKLKSCSWLQNENCLQSHKRSDFIKIKNTETQISIALNYDNILSSTENCPLKHSTEGDRFPHEYDCTKYYTCSRGKKTPIDCPPGMYYNKHSNYCDLPKNSNCVSICPSDSEYSKIIILFPHELDCSRYYKCSAGIKIVKSCPSGLHYNHKTKSCDQAENVYCYKNSYETSGTSTKEHLPADHLPFEENCPVTYGYPKEEKHFPHAYDCSKYYKCSLGKKVLTECPSGLHYNKIAKYCDWPLKVDCVNSCPPIGKTQEENIFYAHETKSDKYYKCLFGQKILQTCPVGLHYNGKKKICDWPRNIRIWNVNY